ncbi:hypothetical protein B0H66DRAFT_365669 [Apodospora peruviana]|uniref:GH64 domain-containing protein n=1 Tax=Apodospora peruviana TaxID=516989 RepID=A0AAE0HW62_9PEZI|nr:hypothetical protein B0H66DRAFT_365669 [Apodospora peruviana]
MSTIEDVLAIQSKYHILQAPSVTSSATKTNAFSTSATRPNLDIAIQNNTTSADVWAYVTGIDTNRNNAVFILQSDGVTPYYPTSPGSVGSPLQADAAIKLGGPGSFKKVRIPQIVGGRIWLVKDKKLTFLLNPGPALVEPSPTNPSDSNYELYWGFAELTFNDFQAFANITYVDFISVPVSLALLSDSGSTQFVPGFPANGLDGVCNELVAQNNRDRAGWDKLVVKQKATGKNLRALSPNAGIVMNQGLFDGYYQPYVNAVWQKYSSQPLTLNTQVQWGVLKGQVQNGKFVFGNVGAIPQPSAKDIFSCDTGAFAKYPQNTDEMGNIVTRLCAAFNRSTLLSNPNQPDGEKIANYYKESITNHYSRIVHAAHPDGKGYTFAYDDVAPNDDANVAGTVASGEPKLLVVSFGGPASIPAGARSVPVNLGDMARTGGHVSQMIGGRRMMRRGLESWTQMPDATSEHEEMSQVGTREESDLEKGMLRKMDAELARLPPPSTQVAVRRPIDVLIPASVRAKLEVAMERLGESAAYNKYAKPVLGVLGRLLVAVLSLSVRSLVSRVVLMALLVGCSFLLGFFGNGGFLHERLVLTGMSTDGPLANVMANGTASDGVVLHELGAQQ